MVDLFYFTRDAVSLEDIARLAEQAGYRTLVFGAASGPELNTYYNDEDFWQWIPISRKDGDFRSFDRKSKEVIDTFRPVSAFIVAYQPMSWPSLRSLLKRVMECFGGWIGSDTDGWQPIFTFDNIDKQPNPSYIAAVQWREREG